MPRIDARSHTVLELLKDQKYAIDEFQREYRWDQKNIQELLEDFSTRFLANYRSDHERTKVREYDTYFLGSIIVNEREGVRYIIDGQQRLTSLTLLLIYLHHLQQKEETVRPVDITDLIFSEQYAELSFNLGIPEREPCLRALYHEGEFSVSDGDDESIRNMVARYENISEEFPDSLRGTALPYFTDWLIHSVELVKITAPTDEDAYAIFETMNDRGRPLNPADMLKGYLLSQISNREQRRTSNEFWRRRVGEIREAGNEEEETDFIKAWLRARYADTIREREAGAENQDFERIGTSFHKWVRDCRDRLEIDAPECAYGFIRDLFDRYSSHYMRLRRAAQTYTPGLEVIYYNAINNFTLQYPMLLAPIRPDDDDATVLKKFCIVGRYIDILIARRVVNFMRVGYSTMVYGIFRTIQSIRDLEPEPLATELTTRLNDFEATFHGTDDGERTGVSGFYLNQFSKRYVRYFLARIMAHIDIGSDGSDRFAEYLGGNTGEAYQIEHILADKFDQHTEEFQTAEEFARYRNRFGALLLLPGSFNKSYGALPYHKKRRHYEVQNLLARSLTDACYERSPGFLRYKDDHRLPFQPHSGFKKSDIDTRQELYLRLCEEIWDPAQLMQQATV